MGEYTLQQEIKAMAEVPVAFDPGTHHWLYGFGHELVAGLIEVVSGKGVGQFLKEELFGASGPMEEYRVSLFWRYQEGTYGDNVSAEGGRQQGGQPLFSEG